MPAKSGLIELSTLSDEADFLHIPHRQLAGSIYRTSCAIVQKVYTKNMVDFGVEVTEQRKAVETKDKTTVAQLIASVVRKQGLITSYSQGRPKQTTPFLFRTEPLPYNENVSRTRIAVENPVEGIRSASFQSYTKNVTFLPHAQLSKIELGPFSVDSLEKRLGFTPTSCIGITTQPSEGMPSETRHYYIDEKKGMGKRVSSVVKTDPLHPEHLGVETKITNMLKDDLIQMDTLATILYEKVAPHRAADTPSENLKTPVSDILHT